MNGYTFENIIFNPNSKEAKSALYKQVYIGFGVASLLKNANSDLMKATLVGICPESDEPFLVRTESEPSKVLHYPAVIPCKEKELVLCSEPFYNYYELLDRASELANKYGKDCIKQVLIDKEGFFIFKREVYVLLFWREIERKEKN